MKEVLRRLRHGIVDEGCYISKDFKSFARVFKNRFGKEITKVGGTNHVQSVGHYNLHGFFTVDNQPYYYSISDVRYFKINNVLIRTAKDYKDFTGGTNRYVAIKEDMLLDFFK